MIKEINQLKPHPKHAEIYETPDDIRTEWNDLFSSIEDNGMNEAISTTKDSTIISGVRRWLVAKELGWKEIEVKVIFADELEVEEMLVRFNSNREKTYGEKINEAMHLIKITQKTQGKKNGGRNEVIARKLGRGFCRENISKLEKISLSDDIQKSKLNMLKNGASIDAVYRETMKEKQTEEFDIEKVIERAGFYKLINGDSKIELDKIGSNDIDLCFTSIPYWKQREYDKSHIKDKKVQGWGEETELEDYLNRSIGIIKNVYKTLKDTGSFYLNITDTIRDGQYLCIPEELNKRILELGLKLVNKIIWYKKNPKPLNLKRQLQPTYENIFHYVKDVEKYKHRELKYRTKEDAYARGRVGDRTKKSERKKKKNMVVSPYSKFRTFYDENSAGADIIRTAVATSQELKKETGKDHPAVFPETLPLLALLQSTEIGDKVLDVASGSASLGISVMFGRQYVGIEISKEYHKTSNDRLDCFINNIDETEIEEFESLAIAA
jgi:DNA modification methylase